MFDIAAGIAGAVGSVLGGNKEASRQKKFAQNQIQWRVMDAQKAGIHPLYALGASPIQYSPSAVGDLGGALSDMGQNITRARMAAADRKERMAAVTSAAGDTAVERYRSDVLFAQSMRRAELENTLLASQIAQMNGQLPPPNPGGDRGVRVRPGTVLEQPARVTVGSANNPAREPGALTSFQYMRTPDGRGLSIVQSEQSKERTEDDLLAQADWGIRNRLLPMARGIQAPDPREYPPGPGRTWTWDATRQAYYPMTERERRTNRRRRHHIGAWFERIE